MTEFTRLLADHHKQCDEIFATTEAAVVTGDWGAAARTLPHFVAAMEAHFAAEEAALFPAFERATGMCAGPTQVMRAEHAQMRALFDQMGVALAARERDAFCGATETLLVLMQQHNLKEENILYPMCARSLADQADSLGAILRAHLATA